jgi:chromosome segregation ATPase
MRAGNAQARAALLAQRGAPPRRRPEGEPEAQLERTRSRVAALERRRDELETEIEALEGRREQVRADLVRYERGTGSAIVRATDVKPFTISIEHRP